VNLSVDMLNQEIVTFSGDTATAKLDIQIGKGPFAPAADGLVKIGETMTLVVSVEGDPGFDLQVGKLSHIHSDIIICIIELRVSTYEKINVNAINKYTRNNCELTIASRHVLLSFVR